MHIYKKVEKRAADYLNRHPDGITNPMIIFLGVLFII